MGRHKKQNAEIREAMTFRIANGATRSAAAAEVARVYKISISTAYKSYFFDDNGTRRVAIKKSNVAAEYNECIQNGTLTQIYKVLEFPLYRPETVRARTGYSLDLIAYARKWGPKFQQYEAKK